MARNTGLWILRAIQGALIGVGAIPAGGERRRVVRAFWNIPPYDGVVFPSGRGDQKVLEAAFAGGNRMGFGIFRAGKACGDIF